MGLKKTTLIILFLILVLQNPASAEELDISKETDVILNISDPTSSTKGYYFPSGIDKPPELQPYKWMLVDERMGAILGLNQSGKVINVVFNGRGQESFRGIDSHDGKFFIAKEKSSEDVKGVISIDNETGEVKDLINLSDQDISLRGGIHRGRDGKWYSLRRNIYRLSDDWEKEEIVVSSDHFDHNQLKGIHQTERGRWIITSSEFSDKNHRIHVFSEDWGKEIDTVDISEVKNPVGAVYMSDKIYVVRQYWGTAEPSNAKISVYNYEWKKTDSGEGNDSNGQETNQKETEKNEEDKEMDQKEPETPEKTETIDSSLDIGIELNQTDLGTVVKGTSKDIILTVLNTGNVNITDFEISSNSSSVDGKIPTESELMPGEELRRKIRVKDIETSPTEIEIQVLSRDQVMKKNFEVRAEIIENYSNNISRVKNQIKESENYTDRTETEALEKIKEAERKWGSGDYTEAESLLQEAKSIDTRKNEVSSRPEKEENRRIKIVGLITFLLIIFVISTSIEPEPGDLLYRLTRGK